MNGTLRVFGGDMEVSVHTAEPDLGTTSVGRTDYGSRRIKIARAHPDAMDETLFHELIHVVSQTAQLGFKEGQIESLGVLLLGLLKDNGFWQSPHWWEAAKRLEAGGHDGV